MKNGDIAKALRACDWSNVTIGNKAIIGLAIDALAPPLLPQQGGWTDRMTSEQIVAIAKKVYGADAFHNPMATDNIDVMHGNFELHDKMLRFARAIAGAAVLPQVGEAKPEFNPASDGKQGSYAGCDVCTCPKGFCQSDFKVPQ